MSNAPGPDAPMGESWWREQASLAIARTEAAEAERDALRATVNRVRALCDYDDPIDASQYDAGRVDTLDRVRATLEGDNE